MQRKIGDEGVGVDYVEHAVQTRQSFWSGSEFHLGQRSGKVPRNLTVCRSLEIHLNGSGLARI